MIWIFVLLLSVTLACEEVKEVSWVDISGKARSLIVAANSKSDAVWIISTRSFKATDGFTIA